MTIEFLGERGSGCPGARCERSRERWVPPPSRTQIQRADGGLWQFLKDDHPFRKWKLASLHVQVAQDDKSSSVKDDKADPALQHQAFDRGHSIGVKSER